MNEDQLRAEVRRLKEIIERQANVLEENAVLQEDVRFWKAKAIEFGGMCGANNVEAMCRRERTAMQAKKEMCDGIY